MFKTGDKDVKIKFVGVMLAATLIAPQAGNAQGRSYYTCSNKPIALDIPEMPLGEAVEAFTRATHCAVSLDVEKVANADAADVPTYAVKGRFTAVAALRKMLWTSPLKVKAIKGGYSIYMN